MIFHSINPYTEQSIAKHSTFSESEVNDKIAQSEKAFLIWRNTDVDKRLDYIKNIRNILIEKKNECASIITEEMGKVLVESQLEIDKCIWLCDYYIENTKDFLKNKKITTESRTSYVRYDPIGVVLGIMPWNFPFWQVFRFAIPTMIMGNTVLLKHAPNVIGCALLINDIFKKSNPPVDIYRNLIVKNEIVEKVIENNHVRGVSFTGSDNTGRYIGRIAGYNLKPVVLELGGSDPFIVFNDAVLKDAVKGAINSRFLNSGQSCIAAKRFIVQDKIYNDFKKQIIDKVSKLNTGNPLNKNQDIGPLARKDLVDNINKQVENSIKKGAKVVFQKKVPDKGFFYSPTILEDVKPGMPVFDQEVFGPVMSIIKFNDFDEALLLSNQSKFGLGASLWTKNESIILKMIDGIESGMVFVNEITKSDPRLPFGGIKDSGLGRELSFFGLREFSNIKTVSIK